MKFIYPSPATLRFDSVLMHSDNKWINGFGLKPFTQSLLRKPWEGSDMVENRVDEEIIDVKNLTKIYSNGTVANDHITMRIKRGEIVGIVGPNGAGKTTLIKQLTGELLPTDGEIYIMGRDVIKNPSFIKPFIGVCPQEGSLIPYLTVREHIYYFGRLKGLSKTDAEKNTNKILNMLNLKSYEKKRISELSGGLKRRVFVGIALVNEPPIIFLDEPTTGLDPISRIEFWRSIEKIRKINPQTTVIITTHYLEELDKVSERLIFINQGKIILEGSNTEVRNLILDYDVKMTIPANFKKIIEKALSKEGIEYKIKENFNKIDILMLKKDMPTVIPIIIKHTSDIIISSPTLDEVFIGVMRK